LRYSIRISALIFLLLSVSGCVFADAEMPDDFSLVFSWNTGALPPAYRYDYVITIGPGEQGEFDFIPGYGDGNDPNRWTTAFEVTNADLQALFTYFQENGFFNKKWGGGIDRVGGSTTSMTLTAFGKDHPVPSISSLEGADLNKVENAQSFIRGFVPDAVWEEMEARQQAFESSQPD